MLWVFFKVILPKFQILLGLHPTREPVRKVKELNSVDPKTQKSMKKFIRIISGDDVIATDKTSKTSTPKTPSLKSEKECWKFNNFRQIYKNSKIYLPSLCSELSELLTFPIRNCFDIQCNSLSSGFKNKLSFEENRSSTIAILEHGDSCLWEHLYKFTCWPFLLWNGFKTFSLLSFSNQDVQSINLTLSLICSPTSFWKNLNLELCLSLIMHHGQKWRLEIENLLKTSNPSFIKLIMKREMSDLKGNILKLHVSTMIYENEKKVVEIQWFWHFFCLH